MIDAISTYINGCELDQVSVYDMDAYEDTEINWRVSRGYGVLIAAYGAACDVALNTNVTRIDHRIPAIAGLQPFAGDAVVRVIGGILAALIEVVDRGDEVGALARREGDVDAFIAPRRPAFVDLETERAGNRDERIFVGGMQPAATDVEHHAGRGQQVVAAAAKAVARFQHQYREARVLERVGGAEAGGTGANDRDIDFGGETCGRHNAGSSTFAETLEASSDALRYRPYWMSAFNRNKNARREAGHSK
jgi:hypothetical protein